MQRRQRTNELVLSSGEYVATSRELRSRVACDERIDGGKTTLEHAACAFGDYFRGKIVDILEANYFRSVVHGESRVDI